MKHGHMNTKKKRYHYVMSPQYLRKEPSWKTTCILNLGYFRQWPMSNIFTWLILHSKWILKELSVIPLHPLGGNDCTTTLYYWFLDTENYIRNSISWHYCNWWAKKLYSISAAKCFLKHFSYYLVLKFICVKKRLSTKWKRCSTSNVQQDTVLRYEWKAQNAFTIVKLLHVDKMTHTQKQIRKIL